MSYVPARTIPRETAGGPVSAGELAKAFFKKFESAKKAGTVLDAVAENWDACAGILAGKCRPVGISAGTLYVDTDNSAIRQELIFAEKMVLRKIAKIDGCPKIKRIVAK